MPCGHQLGPHVLATYLLINTHLLACPRGMQPSTEPEETPGQGPLLLCKHPFLTPPSPIGLGKDKPGPPRATLALSCKAHQVLCCMEASWAPPGQGEKGRDGRRRLSSLSRALRLHSSLPVSAPKPLFRASGYLSTTKLLSYLAGPLLHCHQCSCRTAVVRVNVC